MDAPLVRTYLEALSDAPIDPGAIPRVRACLASLQDPDVRYLVAAIVGPDAAAVGRVMSAVLEAAGAPTGTLGCSLDDITLSGIPLDDGLIAAAGTHAASAIYTLHETKPALGETGRREAVVLLGLVAFAEGGRRVALLLDDAIREGDPTHAPMPDLVVLTPAPPDAIARGLRLIPNGRPAVVAALGDDARQPVVEWDKATGSPLLLGGRDHEVRPDAGGRLTFVVRGEPYVSFDPIPGLDPVELSCALASSLALGTLGIRMREDWFTAGLDALRSEAMVST